MSLICELLDVIEDDIDVTEWNHHIGNGLHQTRVHTLNMMNDKLFEPVILVNKATLRQRPLSGF